MPVQAGISRVAAALADPAREAILAALADGRALPAGELAAVAGISAQSASGHLRKLVEGRILAVWQQGRFRYFRLADGRSRSRWRRSPSSPGPVLWRTAQRRALHISSRPAPATTIWRAGWASL